MQTVLRGVGVLGASTLAVLAFLAMNLSQPQETVPEIGALVSHQLSDECRTPFFSELSEISTHSGDPRLDQHAELLTRCNEEINQQLAATSRVRLIDRQIAPYEGLLNFETPHVHPIDLTPDKTTVLAVNTAAATLEVFRVSGQSLVLEDTIAVGIDPVSVRARSNNEVWVINQISDSVSVVDLSRGTVVQTLSTENEPADVVFAGTPERAFVTASEVNHLNVFELSDLDRAPQIVRLQGEDPRALAVSNDGNTVYAAIFESSNDTYLNGTSVARNDPNQTDNDVAIVNANNLNVHYQTSLMNMVMALAVNPSSGQVSAVGTQSLNHIAQEPNLNGIFVQVHMANFVASSGTANIVDLNPHLDYTSKSIPLAQRLTSLGDPRGIAFNADGSERYIVGMGSNNLIISDASGTRLGLVDVGSGPTGIVVNNDTELAYVLNRFEGSVSVVDLTAREEVGDFKYYDPTPSRINAGRVFLYNTHISSGLGQASCGSCHVDARTDRLGWDLGDPNGATVSVPEGSNNTGMATGRNLSAAPLKGVMVTQTLQDIMEHPNLHWRGDKADINGFNGTFTNLMGTDTLMSQGALDTMADYLATIWFPPNPYRGIDDSRPRTVTLPDGTTATARASLNGLGGDNRTQNNCLRCHTAGMTATRNFNANSEVGSIVMSPGLSAIYDKIGKEYGRAGFGFFHSGVAGIKRASRFSVSETDPGLLAELLTLDSPTGPLIGGARRLIPHAGVGQQVTLNTPVTPAQRDKLGQFISIASDSQYAALIAKARINGLSRGFVHTDSDHFSSDIAGESSTRNALIALAESGTPVTFTLVAEGTQTRLGIDIDGDNILDGDEANESNAAPVIQTPSSQSNTLSDSVALEVVANDSDGDSLRFEAAGLPSGLSINTNSGHISGSVTALGTFNVTVTASDGNAETSVDFLWFVNPADISIDSGTTQSTNVSQGTWKYYTYSANADIDRVVFDLSGLSDDVDLYVRRDTRPIGNITGGGTFDGSSTRGGNSDEHIELPNTGATVWHIAVHGYRASAYQLTANGIDDDNTGGGTGGGNAVELTSGQSASDNVPTGAWRYYTLVSTASDTQLQVDLTDLQADSDLYVRAGARPSGHIGEGGIYDCDSTAGGTSSERCVLDNTEATTWHIGVHGYQASDFSLVAALTGDGGGGGGTDDRNLNLDQAAQASVTAGQWHHYVLNVPADNNNLQVELSGLSDDVDLYVRRGARTTGNVDENGSYDCGSFAGGSTTESCTLPVEGQALYYISIYGYRSSDYRLLARASGSVVNVQDLSNGAPITGQVATGQWHYYKLDTNVPNSRLDVSLDGLSADIDLYVREGQIPAGDTSSGANSDCFSLNGGTNDETCQVPLTGSQSWYVGIYGYAGGDYRLTATAVRADNRRAQKNLRPAKGANYKVQRETSAVTSGAGGSSDALFLMLLMGCLLRRCPASKN